jgi:hypothetical protein
MWCAVAAQGSCCLRLPRALFMLSTSFSPWTVFRGLGLLRPQSSPPHQRGGLVSLPLAPPGGRPPPRRIRHQNGTPSSSVRTGTLLLHPRLRIVGAFDAVLVRGKLGKESSVPSVRGVGGTQWGFRFPCLLADAGRHLGVSAGGRRVPPARCYPSLLRYFRQHISLVVEAAIFWLRPFPDLLVLRHPPRYIFTTREPFVMVHFDSVHKLYNNANIRTSFQHDVPFLPSFLVHSINLHDLFKN